jgi:hypothetical protein
VILEGELPGGEPRERAQARLVARALRPPPPFCSAERIGPLANRGGCRFENREVTNPQLALANAALLSSAGRAEAVIPPPSGEKQRRNSRMSAARVAGPGRIFLPAFLAALDLRILFSYTEIDAGRWRSWPPTFLHLA